MAGFGPAGMFAALVLAEAGLRPLVLERGRDAASRHRLVEEFWQTGRLDPPVQCAVRRGRRRDLLRRKAEHRHPRPPGITGSWSSWSSAAPRSKSSMTPSPIWGPTCSSPWCRTCAAGWRSWGARSGFKPSSPVWNTETEGLAGLSLEGPGGRERLPCRQLILAIGHSARDTFSMLASQNIAMEPKPFAMGVRIEHLQHQIDLAQYGGSRSALPPADYKLFCHLPDRTVYTFCMCPGGYVVAAASEEGGIVTNGMSYSGRSGTNANAALLVSLQPKDFPYGGPLGGMRWQRELEQLAYQETGGYRAPAQRVGGLPAGRPVPTLWGRRPPPTAPALYPGTSGGCCLPSSLTPSHRGFPFWGGSCLALTTRRPFSPVRKPGVRPRCAFAGTPASRPPSGACPPAGRGPDTPGAFSQPPPTASDAPKLSLRPARKRKGVPYDANSPVSSAAFLQE